MLRLYEKAESRLCSPIFPRALNSTRCRVRHLTWGRGYDSADWYRVNKIPAGHIGSVRVVLSSRAFLGLLKACGARGPGAPLSDWRVRQCGPSRRLIDTRYYPRIVTPFFETYPVYSPYFIERYRWLNSGKIYAILRYDRVCVSRIFYACRWSPIRYRWSSTCGCCSKLAGNNVGGNVTSLASNNVWQMSSYTRYHVRMFSRHPLHQARRRSPSTGSMISPTSWRWFIRRKMADLGYPAAPLQRKYSKQKLLWTSTVRWTYPTHEAWITDATGRAHARSRRVRARARTPAHLCLIISRGDRWGLVVTFDAGGHGQNTWRSGDKIASVISFAIPFDTKIILRVAYRKRDSGGALLRFGLDILSRRWNMYRPTVMCPRASVDSRSSWRGAARAITSVYRAKIYEYFPENCGC